MCSHTKQRKCKTSAVLIFGSVNESALDSHAESDDTTVQGIIDSMGCSQPTMLINESGPYSLIFSNKLPRHKALQTLGDE